MSNYLEDFMLLEKKTGKQFKIPRFTCFIYYPDSGGEFEIELDLEEFLLDIIGEDG